MGNTTGERLTATAATLAALITGLGGLAAAQVLFTWDPPLVVPVVAAVVSGVAAVVTLVVAVRGRDRPLLAIAVSVLALALSSVVPGLAVEVLVVVAQGALLAFGIRIVRGEEGAPRVLGWIVAVAAALWFVAWLSFAAVPLVLLAVSQEAMNYLFPIAPLSEAVGYLAAAALVARPLLRPVGNGARALWSSAEVR